MAEDTMPDDVPVAPWDWPRACPYPRRGDLEAAFACSSCDRASSSARADTLVGTIGDSQSGQAAVNRSPSRHGWMVLHGSHSHSALLSPRMRACSRKRSRWSRSLAYCR